MDLQEGPRALGRLDPASAPRLRLGLPAQIPFPRTEAGTPLPLFTASPETP